jgi:GNAT superfamily N-acetyltransferase/predicted nucleic acid-binding protein
MREGGKVGEEKLAIREVEPGSKALEDVLRLGKADRRWLGFLPDAGFTDRCHKGTLLAAVEGDRTLGYVLYDLPGDRVKIVHLCVASVARRRGVARLLVDELRNRHSDRRGIELACRDDFPAATMWPKLGFRPADFRPGRSRAGHLLTIWLMDHGHKNLFNYISPDRDFAALDNNVFEDLATNRPGAAPSLHLEDDWIAEHVELCVTDEVFHESNECDDDALRKALLARAGSFWHLASEPDAWQRLVPIAAELVPGAGVKDHRHLARAAAGGAVYFVTRDREILKAREDLHRGLRIMVLRPEALISRLDQTRSTGRYEPVALQGTEITVCAVDAIDQEDFVRAFLNYGRGERALALREVLRLGLARPNSHDVQVFRDGQGRLIGGFVREKRPAEVEVKLIRVGSPDRLGNAMARQLAFVQRAFAADEGLGRVIVSDPNPSPAVSRALVQESYRQDSDQWICRIQRGLLNVGSGGEPGSCDVDDAVGIERTEWPVKVVGAGIPTFMVPVRPSWAQELFDTDMAEGTLFGRSLHLGLSREHVYYRRPRNARGIDTPARILWYVTGNPRMHLEGKVRAVSMLAEVVVGKPRSLYRRFAQLGVYTEEQVIGMADANGEVMALRFVDTELFKTPVGLGGLRDLYADDGKSFSAPLSPQRVDEHTFRQIYARSSVYVS